MCSDHTENATETTLWTNAQSEWYYTMYLAGLHRHLHYRGTAAAEPTGNVKKSLQTLLLSITVR